VRQSASQRWRSHQWPRTLFAARNAPPNDAIANANPGTVYSATSNIDLEISDENAAAVAIRFHAACNRAAMHALQLRERP
jgi:hypothetical protein